MRMFFFLERESGGDSHTGLDGSLDQSQRIDGQIVTDFEEEGETDDEGEVYDGDKKYNLLCTGGVQLINYYEMKMKVKVKNRGFDGEAEEQRKRICISELIPGMSNVLEVLESSFRGSISAMFQDLHHLQENILKTKQHLEILAWCIRHQFLENLRCRFDDFAPWSSSVRERKSAAIRRAWPDSISHVSESNEQSPSSLFIEDALSNLETEQGYSQGDEGG